MKLISLLEKLEYTCLQGSTDQEVKNVIYDSRKVEEGSLFICIRGAVVDGHKFVPDVVAKGAKVLIVEEAVEAPEDVTVILVKDTRYAMAFISAAYFGYPAEKLKTIGITGTKGKTTTTYMVKSILENAGYKVGLISTVCNYIDDEAIPTEHTTPDPITLNRLLGKMADEGCKYAFMEVSSHSIAQKRISGLKFAGGIFTNLTRDHLDYHKTVENYLKAKKKFFDDMPKNAFSLTNLDDKNGLVMTQNTRSKVYTYSLRSLSNFKGRVLESHFEGMLLDFNNHELAVQFLSLIHI